MSRAILSLVLGLLIGNLARAEVVVELVPDNPGPYRGGETLTVDVWLHSEVDYWAPIALARLDFSQSDPDLMFDATFAFDYSPLTPPHGYEDALIFFPNLPVPETYNGRAIYCENDGCSDMFLTLPPGGSLHLGGIGLELPAEAGTHRMDILNAGESDPDLGAMFYLCNTAFEPVPLWRAYTGDITGASHDFVVRPVPTLSEWGLVALALCLLTVGCVIILRRRQDADGQVRVTAHAGDRRSSHRRKAVQASIWPLLISAVLAVCTNGMPVHAEMAEIGSQVVQVNVDSGDVSASGSGSDPVVVFSDLVTITDVAWVRFHFEQVTLSGSPATNEESFLRLTSQLDAAVQLLNTSGLNAWSNTSGYLNGESVLVELLAYPGTGNNRVVIDTALVGISVEGRETPPSGICGEDDRVLSGDPRVGRIVAGCDEGLPAVGTAFLVSSQANGLLTAGHCCSKFYFDLPCVYSALVEFNVPPSTPGGQIVHPDPEHQYPIDENSVLNGLEAPVFGGEWCFFGRLQRDCRG